MAIVSTSQLIRGELKEESTITDLYQLISASVPPLLGRSRCLTRNLTLYSTELAWLRKSYFLPLIQFSSLGALNKSEIQKSLGVMLQLMEEARKHELAARADLDGLMVQVSKIRALTYAVLSAGSAGVPVAGATESCAQPLPTQCDDIKRLVSVLMAAANEQQTASQRLHALLEDCGEILARLRLDDRSFARRPAPLENEPVEAALCQ